MTVDLVFRGIVLPLMGIWAAVSLVVNLKRLWRELFEKGGGYRW